MIAEGEKVVVRLTFSGTHRGEFMGIAPTNKLVTVLDRWRQVRRGVGFRRQTGLLAAARRYPADKVAWEVTK